jgi:hypothetical protein
LVAILVGSQDHRIRFWKGAIHGSFHQSFVAIGPVVSEEKICMWISHMSYVKLSSAVGLSWSKGRTAGHIFGREPSNDYFIKILFLLSKWFQTRRFLWEFPIGQTSRNLLRSCQSFGLTDMKILSDRNIFCRSEKKAPKYSLSCA